MESVSLEGAETLRASRLGRYHRDPLGFVKWAFPWGEEGGPLANHKGPEKWQADVLTRIGEGLRAGKGPVRIAVASGHGVGKSALVAWLLLWAMATQPSTRGVVTANTETQLKTKTWAELGKWHRLALSHNWCDLGASALVSALPETEQGGRIDMVPWAAHNAEAFAGLHNKGSRVLLVFDEASAIADPIWETAEGALTDAGTEIVWVAFGNPTRTNGRFFECFNRFRKRWLTQQVDSRKVTLTDKRQLARWVADYGEDSDFVRVRVRGRFPRAGTMQFIGGDLVEAAMARLPDPAAERRQPLVMGVDVARFGDDRSVIFLRKGRDARSYAMEKHRGLDLMTLAGRVAERAAAEQVAAVFVDESVNTLYRTLGMTSFQLVERFGRGAVSVGVRDRYDRGEWDHMVEVVHAIEPNEEVRALGEAGGLGRSNRHMPFRSVWYEKSAYDESLLSVGGFEEFPALCPRWHLAGNDVYGRSPGMDALPDAKSLQRMQLRFAETLDKMVNPPMVASPALRGQAAASTPAAVTYVADPSGVGFKPAYQIKPPLAEFSAAVRERQQAVRAAFYADLFLMATQLEDVRSATEVAERRAEKLVMLGPVLERLHDDLLEPLIGRVFQIMARAGQIPPPPFAELDGLRLQPEYVSPMQALQAA